MSGGGHDTADDTGLIKYNIMVSEDISICCQWMCSGSLGATTSHFNILGLTLPMNHIPIVLHTMQIRTNDAIILFEMSRHMIYFIAHFNN